ncbi:ribonuclease H-like domain-containing protein [Tanacetum coccineum]
MCTRFTSLPKILAFITTGAEELLPPEGNSLVSCPWSSWKWQYLDMSRDRLLPNIRGGCSKLLAAFSVARISLGLLDRLESSPWLGPRPQLDNEDLEQIDTDDLEEMDLKWRGYFARDCSRLHKISGNRTGEDAPRRIVLVETPTNSLVVQDGISGYDWSYQAEEGPTDFALMAHLSPGCQLGLESLEARIVVHQKNEAVYEEDIAFLKYDVKCENEIEKENNQVNDRFKKVEGYHASASSLQWEATCTQDDLSFTGLGLFLLYKTSIQSSSRAATSISTARPVNITAPKSKVNDASPIKYSYFKAHSPIRKAFNHKSAAKNNNLNEKFKTARVNNVTTAGSKAVVNAAMGNRENVVKSSACWIWRPTGKAESVSSDGLGSPRETNSLILSAGHMTGNKSYLTYYQDIDGGFVAFAGSPKGGKITGKGKIRTGKLDFEDVYFVKELKFNLFLFLKSRQNNMYNFGLKNVVPSGGLTCLFAKATIVESNLWHKRLGHINFKTMNKLVKGNLVRGLPSKLFENDLTCVAY